MSNSQTHFNKARFVDFCDAAHANTQKQGRIIFLKNLSEYLSRGFDLPLYMPGETSEQARVEEFYKNDITAIVENICTERFNVEEILNSYLEQQ
jgi:hypothetical protein